MRYNGIRCNDYLSQKKSAAPGSAEDLGEFAQARGSQVPELFPVSRLYRPVEFTQDLQPLRRDPGENHPPVLRFPATRDQASLLQAIEESGNVRVPGDHAVGNLAAGRPSGEPRRIRSTLYWVGERSAGFKTPTRRRDRMSVVHRRSRNAASSGQAACFRSARPD